MEPNRLTTVGQLRAALEGIPDETPLVVNAADWKYPEEFIEEQVITSVGFGFVDWGDGHGLEQNSLFALNCHLPTAEDDAWLLPVRPTREPGREPRQPQAEAERPEAEL